MITAKYICLRFFIVPLEEHLFTKPAPEKEKLQWFKKAFLANRDHEIGAQEFAVRITEEEGNLVFGKLSKKRFHEMHPKTSDDIKDVITEDWPYLEFLCDCTPREQVIIIEYNSAVIHRIAAVKGILENLVGAAMYKHGYMVRFEPIVDDTTFWGILQDAENVYSLTFQLNSPNLFGADIKANEALKDLRGVFNNTRMKITLENEKGDLKVPPNSVDTYREYADKGGGEWAITARSKGKSKKKKKYVSTERAFKVPMEKLDSESLSSRLKAVYEQFLGKLK